MSPLEQYWKNEPTDFPTIFTQKKMSKELLRDAFVNLLRNHAPTITSDAIGLQKQWSDKTSAEIIDWVKRKLNLPTSDE